MNTKNPVSQVNVENKKNWVEPDMKVIGKDVVQSGNIVGGVEGQPTVSGNDTYTS